MQGLGLVGEATFIKESEDAQSGAGGEKVGCWLPARILIMTVSAALGAKLQRLPGLEPCSVCSFLGSRGVTLTRDWPFVRVPRVAFKA